MPTFDEACPWQVKPSPSNNRNLAVSALGLPKQAPVAYEKTHNLELN